MCTNRLWRFLCEKGLLRLDQPYGKLRMFVINDKCAAGTGRFLEMVSKILELNLDETSEKGLNWKNNVEISGMCSVFAESEVVSLIANNTPIEDIINGLNNAVALKLLSLINRANAKPSFIMTNGVSKNKGIVNTLSKKTKQRNICIRKITTVWCNRCCYFCPI